MTKIVRERPEVEDDEDIVRFQVYMSPKDKKTVLGVWEHAYQSGACQVTFPTPPFGPVEQALRKQNHTPNRKECRIYGSMILMICLTRTANKK